MRTKVFDYALDAEFKARVRAANDFFIVFHLDWRYNVFEYKDLRCRWAVCRMDIKDCEVVVDYVVLASNDFAVIASIILPVNNLDSDKCRVSSSR